MARPHWLAQAGKTKTPELVVCFDTETYCEQRGKNEVLTLRCWNAAIRQRPAITGGKPIVVEREGETAAELVAVLEAGASMIGEAWVFAHNLGFDLTITSLPMVLATRGWETKFVNIGDESCSFVLTREGEQLVLTDAWSWLRSPLSKAARDVGMRSTPLPAENDPLVLWHKRCRHDVMILDALVADLMDWWDANELGAFGITGSACGWRSLRAHTAPAAVLVGSEPPRTVFERRALYGGRKEVWQVGQVKHKWVADYDLVAAHLTTVAKLPLPTVPLKPDRIELVCDPLRPLDGIGTICEVEITTETPCAPVRVGDDIWWPVGTFRSVLTSAELPSVVACASNVRLLESRWYRLGVPLQPWAEWCLWLLEDPAAPIPAVVRRVAKGWGRSVPGRFALRTTQLIGEREATHLGWALENGHDLDTGDAIEIITYAGRERTYRKDQDGADVFPAVLAFIEGHLRAAMTATLASRDPHRLLQCNTDGWWEVCAGKADTVQPPTAPEPYRITRRAHERGITVIGPNHVQTPGERRLSGIPRTADDGDHGGYVWQDWPGLRWQLEFSRPGEYIRPRRETVLQDHYCRRWVLTSGETVPVSTVVNERGETVILPWSQTTQRRPEDQLAEHQVKALTELADDAPPAAFSTHPAARHPLGRR